MRSSVGSVVASLLTAAIVSACSGATGTATTRPSTSGGPVASASPNAPSAAVPSGGVSASPSEPASPSAGFACPPMATSLTAPSNRLTDVVVTPRDGYDEVAFVFGPDGSGSGVTPAATVRPVDPPFVAGASGLPLAVDGDSFVAVTLRDMVVADESGSPTYAGPSAVRPSSGVVAEVVQAEAFEGVVTWIVGSHGADCVRVVADEGGSRILVDVRRR